jgi:transposase-like protein
MARKRHTPDEIVAKLRQVDVRVGQGQAVAEAIRAIGVTEATYYRWRREFGGLKADQVRRLRDLEAENARLRRAVADLTLDKQILAEAARGALVHNSDSGRSALAGGLFRRCAGTSACRGGSSC